MGLFYVKSILFCPANKPERYEKALATSTDYVIFDWEDAVPPSLKAETRKEFLAWFTKYPNKERIGVRINSTKTLDGIKDLVALAELDICPQLLVIPKVESAEEIRIIKAILQKKSHYIAMIESAKGIANASDIAQADKQVAALLVGAADLSSALGCTNNKMNLLYANSAVIAAASQASIACIDSPYFDMNNEEGLKEDTLKGKNLGFTARASIHPNHLSTIENCYTPTAEELKESQEIVAAAEKGVGIVNGKMVDEAMTKKAYRTITLKK